MAEQKVIYGDSKPYRSVSASGSRRVPFLSALRLILLFPAVACAALRAGSSTSTSC